MAGIPGELDCENKERIPTDLAPCQEGISEWERLLVALPGTGTVEEEGDASPWLSSRACEPSAGLC